jgi:hypothetical protein
MTHVSVKPVRQLHANPSVWRGLLLCVCFHSIRHVTSSCIWYALRVVGMLCSAFALLKGGNSARVRVRCYDFVA